MHMCMCMYMYFKADNRRVEARLYSRVVVGEIRKIEVYCIADFSAMQYLYLRDAIHYFIYSQATGVKSGKSKFVARARTAAAVAAKAGGW